MKRLFILCMALVIAFSITGCQRNNDRLSIKGVREQFNPDIHTSFLVTIESKSNYDSVTSLSEMLCFDEWSKTSKKQGESMRLTIEISEEYEIRIFDSYIHVYDGYALPGQSESEYYTISETMDQRINDYLYPFYNKPQDTQLEFWITEDVSSVDFTEYSINPGWMGATEYYGNGYADGDAEYVSYLVSAYPDYADGGSFVTRIMVSDPKVKLLGDLTASSSIEEWDVALQNIGFYMCEGTDVLDKEAEYKKEWQSRDDKVNVTLTKRGDEYLWSMRVSVTNRDNIVF